MDSLSYLSSPEYQLPSALYEIVHGTASERGKGIAVAATLYPGCSQSIVEPPHSADADVMRGLLQSLNARAIFKTSTSAVEGLLDRFESFDDEIDLATIGTDLWMPVVSNLADISTNEQVRNFPYDAVLVRSEKALVMWGNVCTNLVVRYLEHEHKLRHSANLCCCPHDQLSPPIPASLSQFGAPDEVTTTMFYSLIYPYNPVMPKNPLPDLNIFSTESKLQGSYGILKSLELDPAHFYCSHEDMYDHYGSFTPFPLTSSLPSSSQTGSMSLSASPLLSDSPRQILSESPPPPTLPLAGILPDSFNMLLFDAHVPASPRSQNLRSPVVQPNSFAADEAPHSNGDTFGQQSALSHPPHNAGDEEDFSDTEDASQSSSPLRPRIPVSPCPYVQPTYGKTKPDGERSWRAPGPTPPTNRRSSKRHSPVASSSSLSKHPEVIDLTSAEVRTVELPLTPVSMASKASPFLSEEEIEEEEQPRRRGGRKRKSPVDEDDEDSEYEPSAERHATGGLTIPSMKKRRKVKANPNGKKKKMTFSCEYCDQRFTRLADKERHIQTACTAEGALERRVTHDCPTCGKSFARIDAMKRHYFTKHKK